MQRLLTFITILILLWSGGYLSAQSEDLPQDLIITVRPNRLTEFRTMLQCRAGDLTFTLQPLCPDSRAARPNWFIAKVQTRTDLSNWDLAHYIVAHHPDVIYAEPNYPHIDSYNPARQSSRGCAEDPYNEDWPHPDPVDFAWHLGAQYSQLRAARLEDSGEKIRIAHLDTGYDPTHVGLPKYLCKDLQHNFIEGENEYSAVDIGSEGLLKQPGHGTSTLAILAGNRVSRPEYNFDDYIGGAPFAEVVPIRISKSVILYKTSAFVQALYYIMDPQVHCDVVSMSMGGVASQYWAEAVNDAYEHGVVLVTAAGNNIGRLPTTRTVFPARFKRVISACGVCYDHTPYFKFGLFDLRMQGNYGPPKVMDSALAAYTPNILWAKMGCVSAFDLDGGGTSAATPQIAAAVALWLQKYRHQHYDHPWQRVNAVRHALFSSARKDLPESKKYYGNGVLRAAAALQVPPQLDPQPLPQDKVSFPIWTILFGSQRDLSAAQQQMLMVELLRLEYNSLVLQHLFAAIEEQQAVTSDQKERLKEELMNIPYVSKALLALVDRM